MMLVQITDTHIEERGALAYERFDTAANLRNAVAAINAMDPGPDMVLHTGDMAHHGSEDCLGMGQLSSLASGCFN